MRVFLAVFRKTIGDLSDPRTVLAYLAGHVTVLFFLGLGFTNEVPDGVGELPVAEQELELLSVYIPLSWLWGISLPVLLAGAAFAAVTLAKESERGTLGMLLSKPVRRWEVLLAVLAANVVFLFAAGAASALLAAVVMFRMGGFNPAAIGGGVFAVLPETAVYLLFVCVFVGSLGIAAAVVTRNQLRTAVVTALPAVLFFALFVARVLPGSIYEDYSLYVLDVSYHLGNVYVWIHETLGDPLPLDVKAGLALWTGAYELPDGEPEGSLELIGYVDPAASLAAVLALSGALLAFAVVRFQRLDV